MSALFPMEMRPRWASCFSLLPTTFGKVACGTVLLVREALPRLGAQPRVELRAGSNPVWSSGPGQDQPRVELGAGSAPCGAPGRVRISPGVTRGPRPPPPPALGRLVSAQTSWQSHRKGLGDKELYTLQVARSIATDPFWDTKQKPIVKRGFWFFLFTPLFTREKWIIQPCGQNHNVSNYAPSLSFLSHLLWFAVIQANIRYIFKTEFWVPKFSKSSSTIMIVVNGHVVKSYMCSWIFCWEYWNCDMLFQHFFKHRQPLPSLVKYWFHNNTVFRSVLVEFK